jgi:ubiquitin thioesterase protein OTUB1
VRAQRSLDESTSTNLPLIATIAPIRALREEYEAGSRAFVLQIDYLQAQGFHGIRRTRGDGDCFYRCACPPCARDCGRR